ncbi:MAG: helix-turn-helix domain-containing protein [Flavobacteriia bacterium]|jgi:transcriptional regulator with XRE-family HTH domain
MDLKKLKLIRKSKGVTLKEMSKVVGVSAERLSLIERGMVNPSFQTVLNIVDFLGCQLLIVL